MFVDLEADLLVAMPCRCRVTFVGAGRGHKLIGFRCGHPLEAMSNAKTNEEKLFVYEAHREHCVRAAKRWRGTEMEKIGPDEPETGEPIQGEVI